MMDLLRCLTSDSFMAMAFVACPSTANPKVDKITIVYVAYDMSANAVNFACSELSYTCTAICAVRRIEPCTFLPRRCH